MTEERETLRARIETVAQVEDSMRIIRHQRVRELAAESGCSVRDVELTALEAGVVPWRYVRNVGTIGLDGQAKLLRSTAAVVGLASASRFRLEPDTTRRQSRC